MNLDLGWRRLPLGKQIKLTLKDQCISLLPVLLKGKFISDIKYAEQRPLGPMGRGPLEVKLNYIGLVEVYFPSSEDGASRLLAQPVSYLATTRLRPRRI